MVKSEKVYVAFIYIRNTYRNVDFKNISFNKETNDFEIEYDSVVSDSDKKEIKDQFMQKLKSLKSKY